MFSEAPKLEDLLRLSQGYFDHRRAADVAYHQGDGAAATGHAAQAHAFARAFRQKAGLPNTDLAVAEMRKRYHE